MKKSEIEAYMDAYMEGFYSCYDMMIDMIDDDEPSQEEVNDNQEVVKAEPESKPDSSEIKRKILEEKPLEVPHVESKPRTGTNVPEPKNVPHAPERPTHDKFVELFKEGKLPTEVAKALGVSPATAYNHMNKAKQEGELK